MDTVNIKKELPSDKNSIRKVEPMMFSIRKTINIPDEKFFCIMIAATEAVNNAIIHGNKLDKSKKAFIEISACKDSVCITIEDQGTGFDPEKIEDPRTPENLLKEGGRGIFLIKEIADRCRFYCTASGTKVKMEFDL